MASWEKANEQRLSSVHPVLRDHVNQLIQQCDSEGIHLLVAQSMRTWPEQAVLYAKGRTPDEIKNCVPKHGKDGAVTDAPPGYSSHNFGLAVDVCPFTPDGVKLDWDVSHPAWQRVLELAPTFKLAEGAKFQRWADNPHLYLKEIADDPTDAMREAYKLGGPEAAWKIVDAQLAQQAGA